MTDVYDSNRSPVQLGPKLKSGGEGIVYLVKDRPHLLAKIYHPSQAPIESKLRWMRDHPPADPTAALGHVSIAWPADLLFDQRGNCVGFLMTHVRDTIPILTAFNPQLRSRANVGFDRRYLHRVARNLAAAVSAVHARSYVIGDLNEGNVLVARTALVTLIDTDSFQVREHRGTQEIVHHCRVAKAEYTAPELQGKSLASVNREAHHDDFGLAVLTFQLLMEGSHPFRAAWSGNGDPPSLEAKIKSGLFPHQKPPPPHISPPNTLFALDSLHPDLAFLFRRCFVDGHRDPRARPVAKEWERVLAIAENSLTDCQKGHLFSDHLHRCPICGAAAVGTQAPLPASRTFPVSSPPAPTTPSPAATSPASPREPAATSIPEVISRARAAIPSRHVRLVGTVLAGVALLGLVAKAGPDLFGGQVPFGKADRSSAFSVALAGGCWTPDQIAGNAVASRSSLPQWTSAPNMVIDLAAHYTADLQTSKGSIVVELLPQEAPITVNNFICLARAGYYDGSSLFRMTRDVILQESDPSTSGGGGPGYVFADEAVSRNYEPGILAMANAGPNTNGSQFFIVLNDLSGKIPSRYTIFGKVIAGWDIVQAIGAGMTETNANGDASLPIDQVVLERVRIMGQ